MLSRREFAGVLGAGLATAARGLAKARTRPLVCLYSGAFQGVDYTELAGLLGQLGSEGVDLTVMPGGHVEPRIANVDLVRALEDMHGAGVAVGMITTVITSPLEYATRAVLALTGRTLKGYTGEAGIFRCGYWRYRPELDLAQTFSALRREVGGLARIGREYNMQLAIPNRPGFAGQQVWDARTMLEGTDPQWAGLCFDPVACVEVTGEWQKALQLGAPRLKAVVARQVTTTKAVDYAALFAALAKLKFTGPVSVQLEEKTPDVPGTAERELAAVHRLVAANWNQAQAPGKGE